ncbi:hypothetical protein [Shewanella benthica]
MPDNNIINCNDGKVCFAYQDS